MKDGSPKCSLPTGQYFDQTKRWDGCDKRVDFHGQELSPQSRGSQVMAVRCSQALCVVLRHGYCALQSFKLFYLWKLESTTSSHTVSCLEK